MKNIIDRIKEMEPGQIIIFSLAGVAVLVIVAGIFSLGEDEGQNGTDSFQIPENRHRVEDYNSKLDAYGEPVVNGSKVSLDFDLESFRSQNTDTLKMELTEGNKERKDLESEVDSMLRANRREGTGTKHAQRTTRDPQQAASSRGNGASPSIGKSADKKEVEEQFNGFFAANPQEGQNEMTDPMIYAVIHGDHTIGQGERVKLRLTRKAIIAGVEFPKNSYVYAFPTFQTNRVLLEIRNINQAPVDISAYDTEDGAAGLYVKGAKTVGQLTDGGTEDAIDEVDVLGIPVESTIKKVFKKQQQAPKITLINNTKLILKPNRP